MATLSRRFQTFTKWIALPSLCLILAVAGALAADAKPDDKGDKAGEKVAAKENPKAEAGTETAGSSTSAASTSAASSEAPPRRPKYPPYAEVLRDADPPIEALNKSIKLHRKGSTLYAEISPSQLNRDFIVVVSIAHGIGRGSLLAGMSWNFGDDPVWQFRKVDDYIHVVRRNVRFTATRGSPEDKAVSLAFTDSILFSLPIVTLGPSGGYVVDLNQIFMTDFPRISHELPGFSFSSSRSTWATVKGFPDNIELEVAATYASSGSTESDNIPDSRGATVNVHYSISNLPSTGYRPRIADDRVGYFLTVLKDYSQKGDDEHFVRYINRWDVAKADPEADNSPPKKPIIFWLEKTVPYKYRAPIREGILEWNKAFDKAGFVNAIEVRQQPDNADWDPEDINYNTFRWITTNTDPGMVMAMGPSRVNPTNGQILDADIIFDADFLQSWKSHYETFTPANIGALTGGNIDVRTSDRRAELIHPEAGTHLACGLPFGRAMDLAFGGASLAAAATADGAKSKEELEKLYMQGIKETTMHEVGHTLGLRHNFKASAYLSLDDIDNNTEKTKENGFAASVMDYTPVHIVPKGKKQGDYYSTTIGPYDIWAIEYGYKPLGGNETDKLGKIAARSAEPALRYSSDEDIRGTRSGVSIDSDPQSNEFDLGSEPLDYVKQRAELISGLWPSVVDKMVKDGEGYQRARQTFGVLLGNYGRAMHFAARYIGGESVSRSHKGDDKAENPIVVTDAAKQREALDVLEKQVFNDKPFQFPPDLYNHLIATRWDHWGLDEPLRTDYPVHEVILMWQENVLDQLLSPFTLDRLHDSELKVPDDKDAFTTAELLSRLTKVIFNEVDTLQGGEYTNRKPAISSLRRNLQREYLSRLAKLAMGDSRLYISGGPSGIRELKSPSDCETIAYAELKGLQERMNKLLSSNVKLDDYSKAHLTESSARIGKVLDAHIELIAP